MLVVLFVLAFLFLGLLAAAVVVGVTLSSLVTLVTAPGQLSRLLRDRRLRQNHALEHATINVLEERFGPSRLAGLARPDGFLIFGAVSPALVLEAAEEALQRLRSGERWLAIHPRCGTTLIASQLVLGMTFLLTLLVLRQFSILPFVVALIAALLLGPRLSPLLQRWVTTDAQVDDLVIEGLQPHLVPLGLPWTTMLLPIPGALLVRTTLREERNSEQALTIVIPGAPPYRAGSYRIE